MQGDAEYRYEEAFRDGDDRCHDNVHDEGCFDEYKLKKFDIEVGDEIILG